MGGGWLTLALLATPALAAAQGIEPGGGEVDQGIDNPQTVNRPAGDRSVVQQAAGPASGGNVQNVTVASSGEPPNIANQQTQGTGNIQSIVMPGGSGNVVVQNARPGSIGSMQSAVASGTGNIARQDAAGSDTQLACSTGQRSTVAQTQVGVHNHQSVVQTGSGNVAVQTQRGNGLRVRGEINKSGCPEQSKNRIPNLLGATRDAAATLAG